MTYQSTGCGSLGVNEQLLKQNLVVFPIPAKDEMYVQVNGTQIQNYRIITLAGQVVDTKSNVTLDVLKVNTADFKAGTYLIEVETPYGKTEQTFIVE